MTTPASSRLRRKALLSLLLAVACLLACLPLFMRVESLWTRTVDLEGALFLAASSALGLALAALPVLAAIGLLLAAFWASESCFVEGSQPRGAQWALVLPALLLSYAPAIGALRPAWQAVTQGFIALRKPDRIYALDSDPFGFFMGVSYWLVGAVTLAVLATLFWRARFRRKPAQETPAQT
ncbi:hypothetical protein [Uliginosibacterium sp. H1]|uniref:hypothetical protein n=1 Tax=Uliginosibacterium sp. H1 TaxID=3114757 RepID=UPI002E195B4D|nr:hypothetical protein [Uliginosibacterium sp. H1]